MGNMRLRTTGQGFNYSGLFHIWILWFYERYKDPNHNQAAIPHKILINQSDFV